MRDQPQKDLPAQLAVAAGKNSLTKKEFRLFQSLIYEQSGICLTDDKIDLLKNRLSKLKRKKKFSSFKSYYNQVVNDSSGQE
ncbi:MAG: hypothetical protein JRJ59_09595, partial [Deltaproteobacteria bacterium]|nr:hypothetical protein [Deltaproteobacteria bacterium]